MSEPVATTSTEPVTEKPALEPAVAIPKATVGSPDAVLEAIKAKVKAANTPAPVAEPVKEPEPKQEPKVDVAALMAELANTHKQNSELKTKSAAAQEAVAEAALLKEIKELWSKSPLDKLAALQKLTGNDGADELAALWAEANSGDMTSNETKPVDAKVVADIVANAVKEALAARDKAEEETRNKSSVEEMAKAAVSYAKNIGKKYAKDFEVCAREENIDEAANKANAEALKLVQSGDYKTKDGRSIDLNNMSEYDAEELMVRAYANVEAEYLSLAKRFGKQVTEPAKDPLERFSRPLSKPRPQVKQLPKNATFEQVLESARERYAQRTGQG